jgi:hypothetical protein
MNTFWPFCVPQNLGRRADFRTSGRGDGWAGYRPWSVCIGLPGPLGAEGWPSLCLPPNTNSRTRSTMTAPAATNIIVLLLWLMGAAMPASRLAKWGCAKETGRRSNAFRNAL